MPADERNDPGNNNTPTSRVSLPIGKFFKAMAQYHVGGKTLDTRLTSFDININWAEPSQLGGILTPLQQRPPTTDPFFNKLAKALSAWQGTRIRDLPDDLVFEVPTSSIPDEAAPFAEIIPGIPNPGVDPQTGKTPIDAIAGVSAPFLNFLSIIFSMQGLALIGGAILLYIGFKYVMNANATQTV